jgi:hypothetical protein
MSCERALRPVMDKRCGAEEFAIRWAESRVIVTQTVPELEYMLSFKPADVPLDRSFWKAMVHPAVVAFVLCVNDNYDLDDHVHLCEAIVESLRRAEVLHLPAFEFKLWAVVWAFSVGSESSQIELYDVLQCCHDKEIIADDDESERERAHDIISRICGDSRHLHWETITQTPVFDPTTPSKIDMSSERWYARITQFAR